MDTNTAIILFFIESVFFIGILTACLVFAAKKHRRNLSDIVEQVNRSNLFKQESNTGKEDSSKELIEKLKAKISKMQQQMGYLERYEKKYHDLKDKYKALQASTQTNDNVDETPKTIAVGTTVDRDCGVDQNYLNYLSKKKSLNDAGDATLRSSHESRVLNKKIDEQRKVIQSLEADLKSADMKSEIESIKSGKNDAALLSIKKLEQSLADSQKNGRELEANLIKLRKELDSANGKISVMEVKLQENSSKTVTEASANDDDKIVINAKFDESKLDANDNEVELSVALHEYEKIKQEVEILRRNTSEQRTLIFTLEKEILQLKNDLSTSPLSDEEREKREHQISKLERLLQETETCVEVLESEVSYLQDKLTSIEDDEKKSLQQLYEDSLKEIEKNRKMLERATNVRAGLIEIIRASINSTPKEALTNIVKIILDTLEPLDIAVYLKIISQFGEVDSTNSKTFSDDQKDFLSMSIKRDIDTTMEADEGFLVVFKRIGVFVKAPMTQEGSLGKIRDTISFIMLVSNTVITALDENQSNQVRQTALSRLVEGVRKKISQLSIQSKYQSDEAKNIFDGLLKELGASLNTMNITENQSKFFGQMIDEANQRMSLLLASEVVVDKSFEDLLERIERSTVYLQNKKG